MGELVEVSLLAFDEGRECGAQERAVEAQHGRQNHQRPTQNLQTTPRQWVGRCRDQRQVGHRRRQAQLEQGLGPPDVARLADAQLRQACDAVLRHLPSPSSFSKRWTDLQLACLLEQGFLRVEMHRPPAMTPRALCPQRARRAGLGGKDECPASTLVRTEVMARVLVWASARPSLQIDLNAVLANNSWLWMSGTLATIVRPVAANAARVSPDP